MNRSWWRGTRLVAGRTMAEGFASRGWRVATALMLVGALAVIILPRVLSAGPTTYTLATTGPPGQALTTQLSAAAAVGDFTVRYSVLGDETAVRRAIQDDTADVGLVGSGEHAQLYVRQTNAAVFPTLVSAAVRSQAEVDAMTAAGLDPTQIVRIQSSPPPRETTIGAVSDAGRAGVGYVSGIVLYLALILAGTGIATTVATEKSTRVSEVLLAVLRPTQLLVGTVLGASLLALAQIGALAVPVGVWVLASGDTTLPPAAVGDIALAVAWFILGLSLYAFVFAALAALVDKVTEVSSALMPVNMVLIGSYLLAVIVVASTPQHWVSIAGSLFPLTAPLVMPTRWASGAVPVWQLAVSMALTGTAAVLLARAASVVYRRGVVRTGRRLSLKDALHL